MSIRTYPFVGLADQAEIIQDRHGKLVNFQSCDDVNALFLVKAWDSNSEPIIDGVELLPGQKVEVDQEFTKVSIQNLSGSAATGKFTIGTARFIDDRVNGEVQTQISGLFNPLTDLTLDGTVQSIAANPARTNLAIYAPATNSGVVYIGQSGQGIPLPQGGSFVLPTTAAVTVQGTNLDKVHLVEV